MVQNSISLHKKLRGKISIISKISPMKLDDIKLIYTPGVAEVCKQIQHDNALKYSFTSKGNNVAIITDGTRNLGLGNTGPDAALPVIEGKSAIYSEFGKINAFPICLNTTDKNEIIQTIKSIEPVFGAINLEDMESPKVLDIANELEKILKIPIFHDDQHGTAVVVLAALLNSLKIVNKEIKNIKIVIVGSGSAGYGIAKLLHYSGCRNIVVFDSKGTIHKGRKEHMNKYKKEIAKLTNSKEKGSLSNAIINSDVFIGVSGIKNLLKVSMIKKMNKNSIVFALTNPEPEVIPSIAKKAGVKIIATGSFKYHNKVNNAIVFPYLMRVILDLKIERITMNILYNTAQAIANTVNKNKLSVNNIIPELGDKKIQNNIMKSLGTTP
jgi:malate dehydrogenase (oxaloacetate-decarboxylating)